MPQIQNNIRDRCGIYRVVNLINGKVCVGSTSQRFKTRWSEYRCRLNKNIQGNPHLQSAWNKYGEANFELRVIENCPKRMLLEREDYYMDFYHSRDRRYGYNMQSATGCEYGKKRINRRNINKKNASGMLGKKHTEEAKKKIGLASIGRIPWNKGKHLSKKTRLKISRANKGRVLSEEWKRKIGLKSKGRIHSEETRKKIGSALKNNKNSLGRILSEETKKKISLGNKGKIIGEETRIKMRIGHLGVKINKETRRKISESLKGHKCSDETKLKISLKNIGRRLSEETKKKIGLFNKGKKISEETKRKMSLSYHNRHKAI